jgi:N-acetyl-anhydromuramyl-L-alanine amidase AmpD
VATTPVTPPATAPDISGLPSGLQSALNSAQAALATNPAQAKRLAANAGTLSRGYARTDPEAARLGEAQAGRLWNLADLGERLQRAQSELRQSPRSARSTASGLVTQANNLVGRNIVSAEDIAPYVQQANALIAQVGDLPPASEPEIINRVSGTRTGFRPANRTAADIDSVVIHRGQMDNGLAEYLQNNNANVSAHYVVTKDGRIIQLVDNSDVAFTQWYYNSRSIGIECEGSDGDPWSAAQLEALASLSAYLCNQYGIAPTHPAGDANDFPRSRYDRGGLLGHYQVDPQERVNDPGKNFPWAEFERMVQSNVGR